MRDLRGHAALVADADGLRDRVEQHRRLAAHVREIKPVARAHRARERDQLLGVRVRAGWIDEPRGEAPGAGVHRLAEQPLHSAQLVGAGRPRLEAHGRDAQGAVADEVHDVDRRPHAPQGIEILAEGLPREVRGHADATDPALHEGLLLGADRRLGEGAHADDFRRHPLTDLGLRRRAAEVEEVGVRVHVDEAGRDHASGDVEDAVGGAGETRRDGGDALALHGDVGAPGRCPRAVDDAAAAQQERPGHRYSSVMVTDFILSPWRMRSTCSMPLVTLPKTV